MKVKFSYKKNGETINCEFKNLRNVAACRKVLMNYIYDQGDIEKEDWISGCIYEDDECVGNIDYYGNFTEKENE